MVFDFGGDDSLLGIEDICKKLGVSRSTFERLRKPDSSTVISAGIAGITPRSGNDFIGLPPFPAPTVSLGRSPRWSVKDLNEWIAKCAPKV